jgi:hypothetical protein
MTGESPLFLPMVQVLLVLGGGAAWIYLSEARDYERNGVLPAATTVFVLGFESLWRNMKWGFHENAIAFFCASWALALLFAGSRGGRTPVKTFVIFALFLVAALSKEILLLNMALALLVWGCSDFVKGRIFQFVFKFSFSALLIGVFIGFEKTGHPIDKNYFHRYYAYLGSDLETFARNLIFSPKLVWDAIGPKALVRYFGAVFMPWAFLFPLWLAKGRERIWLVAILPSLASAALASYPPLRDIGYHYVLELWPVLACTTVVALSRRRAPDGGSGDGSGDGVQFRARGGGPLDGFGVVNLRL